MNEDYKKIFIYSLLIILILDIFYMFPGDDSLRHVGLAFGKFENWGDVYPFSIFEEFKDYDPWFGYDLTLRSIASFLKSLPISLLAMKLLLTKCLSFLFSLIFFFLVIKRSKILNEIEDRNTFTMVIILVVGILSFTFFRVILARPFAFGTFFIIYSVDQKGFFRGFLASLILSFFYPYLCWFYILPVAFTHFVRGDKKFALGATCLLILFLLVQPASFWGFQIAIFNSDIVRSAINAKIREFISILKSFPFYLYLAGFIIVFPKFKENVRRLNYVNILMLLYIFPALKYNRYFFDIILPLMFVSFGRELVHILLNPYRKFTCSWGAIFQAWQTKLKTLIKWKTKESDKLISNTEPNPGRSLKPYIIVTYLIIGLLLVHINYRQVDSLKDIRDELRPIPEKSLVLTNFNLQYKILFLRPDLRLIPSCEIGFTRDIISKEYIGFLNEGRISQISKKTGAKYFIENMDLYVNPMDGKFLELIKTNGALKLWRIKNSFNNNYE